MPSEECKESIGNGPWWVRDGIRIEWLGRRPKDRQDNQTGRRKDMQAATETPNLPIKFLTKQLVEHDRKRCKTVLLQVPIVTDTGTGNDIKNTQLHEVLGPKNYRSGHRTLHVWTKTSENMSCIRRLLKREISRWKCLRWRGAGIGRNGQYLLIKMRKSSIVGLRPPSRLQLQLLLLSHL